MTKATENALCWYHRWGGKIEAAWHRYRDAVQDNGSTAEEILRQFVAYADLVDKAMADSATPAQEAAHEDEYFKTKCGGREGPDELDASQDPHYRE